MANDANPSKGHPVPDTAIRLQKALAMGHAVETGAGKGATGGKNPSRKTPA